MGICTSGKWKENVRGMCGKIKKMERGDVRETLNEGDHEMRMLKEECEGRLKEECDWVCDDKTERLRRRCEGNEREDNEECNDEVNIKMSGM